jgi:hypothetical protein
MEGLIGGYNSEEEKNSQDEESGPNDKGKSLSKVDNGKKYLSHNLLRKKIKGKQQKFQESLKKILKN